MIGLPFNPIERTQRIEKIVMRDNQRKYYRFRYTRYYGRIITADTVGCNLLCAYCWNYFKNLHPEKHGEFYSPEEVASKLLEIARAKNCHLFRISGAEPILGKKSAEHVASMISHVDGEFILETNRIMLGYSPALVDLFKDLNVVVRVTIKEWDEKSSEKITGAKALADRGIPFWIAVMYDVLGMMELEG